MLAAIEDGVVDDATRDRYLATMHVSALGSLVDDLFELSRLEAGDLDWSIRQVELPGLVDETVAAMRVERMQGASRSPPSCSLTPARARRSGRLQRVLFNLIQNGIRHTPADGSVTVGRLRRLGGDRDVDTGSRSRPHTASGCSRPFVGAGNGESEVGAGLGLALCRAIVEAHGGRIWLADSETGTRVRFVIPT